MLTVSVPRGMTAAMALVVAGLAAGCSPPDEADSDPPWARREVLATLREDVVAERHPSDGGGRAWLVSPEEGIAGGRGSWELVYEAGPLGIDEGGWLFFQVSPFWGWSPPQAELESWPGFTEVETGAAGVTLEVSAPEEGLLAVRILGDRLEEAERIFVRYGAGSAAARVDRFAESLSPFWIAVDGDGDGVRGLLEEQPGLEVRAGEVARLVLTLPTTARPGDTVRLTAALLDAAGNAWPRVPAGTELLLEGELSASGEEPVEFGDEGVLEVELALPTEGGVYSVTGRTDNGLRATSNPLVSGDHERILWADLHGHSGLSDGTGTPEEYFRYARDVAALDVVALTDHDHWGMRPLALHAEMWSEIEEAAHRFADPGRFLTLLGYEWTNWVHGHRHVLYFEDPPEGSEVLSSVDPRFETPTQLWEALRGRDALTVAHHSAGGPIATDWRFAPPPDLEPVTEVASVHGSSEAPDAPGRIYGAVRGNYVRDALALGYRLGFVGSGDSHDGHPGLAHLATGLGGLAAVFAAEPTRGAVLDALRARHVYATNGPRIALWTHLEGRPMGSTLPVGSGGEMAIEVVGTGPIERVDGVVSGEIIAVFEGEGRAVLALAWPLPEMGSGDYAYVRVVQEDGGAAWSSPYFFATP